MFNPHCTVQSALRARRAHRWPRRTAHLQRINGVGGVGAGAPVNWRMDRRRAAPQAIRGGRLAAGPAS